MQRTLRWSRSLSLSLSLFLSLSGCRFFFLSSLDRVHARETLSCTSFPFISDLSPFVRPTNEIALKMIARFIVVVVHASQVFFLFFFLEENVSNHLARNITCVSHVTIVRPAGCGNLRWTREDLESGTKVSRSLFSWWFIDRSPNDSSLVCTLSWKRRTRDVSKYTPVALIDRFKLVQVPVANLDFLSLIWNVVREM